MTEIWKDIKDYEGLYQISNFGRVKASEKTVWNGNKDGYLNITLNKNR